MEHVIDRPIGSNALQRRLVLGVEGDEGGGFLLVDLETTRDGLRVVVLAVNQRRPAAIADALHRRRIEEDVVDRSVLRTAPPPAQALHQNVVVGLEQDDEIDGPSHCSQKSRQALSLIFRPGKPVEEDGRPLVEGRQVLADQIQDELVGHQLSTIHEPLGLPAQLGPLSTSRPKEVSGGDVSRTEILRQADGLGAFADPGRAEEDDDHAYDSEPGSRATCSADDRAS